MKRFTAESVEKTCPHLFANVRRRLQRTLGGTPRQSYAPDEALLFWVVDAMLEDSIIDTNKMTSHVIEEIAPHILRLGNVLAVTLGEPTEKTIPVYTLQVLGHEEHLCVSGVDGLLVISDGSWVPSRSRMPIRRMVYDIVEIYSAYSRSSDLELYELEDKHEPA